MTRKKKTTGAGQANEARAEKNRAKLLSTKKKREEAASVDASESTDAVAAVDTPVSAAAPSIVMLAGAPLDQNQLPVKWRVVGAAVRGVSHERTGAPCQDAQGYRILPDGTLLVALADGAGSARLSDMGAQTAVDAALRALAEPDRSPSDQAGWEEALREAAIQARQAVVEVACESGESLREYASTLSLAIARPDWLIAGQIGDGAVVGLGEDAELFTATRLQRGEYANETHFLVQEDALDQLTIQVIKRPVAALAVMSDGLIRLALKMPSQEPHTPFFQPLFGFVRSPAADQGEQSTAQLAAFLASERVNARTDDDKSLVLAARVKVTEAPVPAAQGSTPQQEQQ